MRRRFLGPLAAGLAAGLVLTLSACGDGSAPAEDGEVKLKLVATEYGDRSGTSTKRYWDQLIGEFQFDNPGISVDVDVYDRGEVDREVAELVKAGNAPDMAQISTYADYAADGKLYSADELLSIPAQADFVRAVAEAGTAQRKQYGLPFTASTRVFFYNKELFEQAGIESPPKTWDELQAAAAALRQSGVTTPYGLPLGPEEAQAEVLNWFLSNGGGFTDNIGGYTLDEPENVKAFTWLRDEMVGKGLTNPEPGRTNRKDMYEAFVRGEVAMLNGHASLMERAAEGGVDFGIAPIPGRTGESRATTGVADWMTAFKANGHREEIGAFLDFVYSKKNALRFAETYDLLPVTNAAFDAMRADEGHRALWEFLDQLRTAQLYPVDKVSWAPTLDRLRKEIGGTVDRGGDPASVLGAIQRKAEATESAG
ncbi:extracellular solute-binding protein [Streptomyces zingiberis]|uniref:Extracellular solute-binding protein n=1 Tax=Streptomyces zingiberis TaxID=2053010 RepID=A0ABX1BZL1_9ACTN|nr:extracellular solute-binding protein [Streptomyces zingiberis]NJQ02558.1 extracellular solute-binding protein [Streptomyces zingiberis]